MQASFDPYREWLGVTDANRPPNFYQLLGLDPFESDLERINYSAMMRMATVLSHDPGPHAEWAQRLYDELDLALYWLSDPDKKQAYDNILRNQDKEATFEQLIAEAPAQHEPLTAYTEHRGPAARATMATKAAPPAAPRVPPPPPPKSTAHDDWYAARRVKPVAVQYLPSGSVWLAGAAVVGMAIGLYLLFTMFREIQSTPDPAVELAARLQSPEKQTRLEAAQGLSKLGPRSAAVIPDLIRIMKSDPEDAVRVAAAEALYNAGPTLSASLPEIKEHLPQEPHPTVKFFLQRILDGNEVASN